MKTDSGKWAARGALLLMIATVVGTFLVPAPIGHMTRDTLRQETYLVSILVGFLIFCLAGMACNRDWRGVLIDNYNRISLSRLQACLWTLVVFPALIVTVAWNLWATPPPPLPDAKPNAAPPKAVIDAFNFNVPSELWILVGISATTLVAAGVIKDDKADKAKLPEQQTVDKAQMALDAAQADLDLANKAGAGVAQADVQAKQDIRDQAKKDLDAAKVKFPAATVSNPGWNTSGNLAYRQNWQDASFTDLFVSDSNPSDDPTPPLDFNRLQQLYLTVLVAGGYGAVLYQHFQGTGWISELPNFSQNALALVVISHGSYLVGKATTKPT